jgi:hypothetical protein
MKNDAKIVKNEQKEGFSLDLLPFVRIFVKNLIKRYL